MYYNTAEWDYLVLCDHWVAIRSSIVLRVSREPSTGLVLSGPWCCHWTGDGAGWRLTGLGGTTGQLLLGGFRGILTLLTLLTPQQYITPSHQSWNYKAPVERRKLFQYFFMKKMWLPWRCSGHSDIAWDLGGIRVELFWDLKYFPSLCHFHEISISCKLTKLLQISII